MITCSNPQSLERSELEGESSGTVDVTVTFLGISSDALVVCDSLEAALEARATTAGTCTGRISSGSPSRQPSLSEVVSPVSAQNTSGSCLVSGVALPELAQPLPLSLSMPSSRDVYTLLALTLGLITYTRSRTNTLDFSVQPYMDYIIESLGQLKVSLTSNSNTVLREY